MPIPLRNRIRDLFQTVEAMARQCRERREQPCREQPGEADPEEFWQVLDVLYGLGADVLYEMLIEPPQCDPTQPGMTPEEARAVIEIVAARCSQRAGPEASDPEPGEDNP